jgi:predicted small integral membrane protein
MFLAIGALWLFVGILTVPLLRRDSEATAVFITERVDTAFYGMSPSELLSSDPALSMFRTMMTTILAGSLLLGGTMFILVAWLGLRGGYAWALVALAVSTALGVAWWAWALRPYLQAGVPMTFGDAPPFIKTPGLLLVPATVLGWIGLVKGGGT